MKNCCISIQNVLLYFVSLFKCISTKSHYFWKLFRKLPIQQKLAKNLCKTSLQVGMTCKSIRTRKGRDVNTQEDYSTSVAYTAYIAAYTADVGWISCLSFLSSFHSRAVFLRSFILCLGSVFFTGPSLLEMKFCRNLFPLDNFSCNATLSKKATCTCV